MAGKAVSTHLLYILYFNMLTMCLLCLLLFMEEAFQTKDFEIR